MKLLLHIFLFITALPVMANYSGKIKLKDKTAPQDVTIQTLDRWGNLYAIYKGEERIFRDRSYIWIDIPKPKLLNAADSLLKAGKYKLAANAYEDAGRLIGKYGWELYCLYGKAFAEYKQDNKAAARKLLEPALTFDLNNPKRERSQLDSCLKLLIHVSKEDNRKIAQEAITLLQKSSLAPNALAGFKLAADINIENSEYVKARENLVQAIVMFKKFTPGRKAALEQMIMVLKEHSSDLPDAKRLEKKYRKMLKRDYTDKSTTDILTGKN